MDNHQADTTTRSIFWLDRFFSAEQLGLGLVGLGIVALAVALGVMEVSTPGREALQVVGRTLEWSIWSRATMLIALWLFSTVVTHILARFMGLRAPFPRALRTTGRAWILYTLVLIAVDLILILFVWLGWTALAEFGHTFVGGSGGFLWVFFYPTAIRIIYGPHARSCLMTVLTMIIVLLLAGIPALLMFMVFG